MGIGDKMEYKLEVEGMDDLGYFSKGHHDKQVFADEVNGQYQGPWCQQADPDDVRHVWWRNKPLHSNRFDVEYVQADGPGRGAFPVTVIYI
jgi:hypothetical protein